jgi:ribA/ribD-fused uncharacterized protein
MNKYEKLDIRNGYALFWGQWPSNWASSPMVIENVRYNCVEQFMMAEKARLFSDFNCLRAIMAAPNPKNQKALGRKIRGFNDVEWEKVRYSIVLKGTLEKYKQNAELQQCLLETGDAVFVECSPYDGIWGIKMGREHPDVTNPSKWNGLNLLGKAITEARTIIKNEIELIK